MGFFGRKADYRATWRFSPNLEGLSKKNFGKEGTSSFGSGFILDPNVITRKFGGYAAAAAKITSDVSGEVEYFEPKSYQKKYELTEVANEMDETVNINHVFNGNWDRRDRLAKEIIEAIEQKPEREELSSAEDLIKVLEGKAVLGADIVFERGGQAANLKFDASNIDSYSEEKSGNSEGKAFEVRLYGDNEFRKQLTREVPDLAGRWSDWDLARNKLKDIQLYGKIRRY